MKNKLIFIGIIIVFIFTSFIFVNAIAATPRVDLDEYQIESTSKDNVYVTGTVSLSLGQLVGIYDSTESILYNYTQVTNSGSEETFKVKIPARYLKDGDNTFKIKSLPVKGHINSSNPKTVTVKIKTQTIKKDQTITATDITLKVGETKNLNAKTSSNLSLTYKSENPSIATIDGKGNIVGRKVGTTKITINQKGNNEYNSANKTITVKVTNIVSVYYTVVYNANGGKGSMSPQKVMKGSSIKLTQNKFTRKGYTFKGWSTTKNNRVVYKNNQTININKSIMLYAIWEGNPVKIKYNANKGKNNMDKPTVSTKVGNKHTIKSGDKLSRDYYVFQGWATSKNGKVKYKPGKTITISKDKDITLYAVWKQASLSDCAQLVYKTIGSEGMWHAYAIKRNIKKAVDWKNKYKITSSAKNVNQLKGKKYFIMCNRAVSISLQQAGYLDKNKIINHKNYGSDKEYAKAYGGTVDGKYYKGILHKECKIYHPNKKFSKLSNKYKPKTGAVYIYESNIAIYDGERDCILSCNHETVPYNLSNIKAKKGSYCYNKPIKIVIIPQY